MAEPRNDHRRSKCRVLAPPRGCDRAGPSHHAQGPCRRRRRRSVPCGLRLRRLRKQRHQCARAGQDHGGAPVAATPDAPSGGGGGPVDVITKASDVPVGGGVILPAKTIVVTQPTKGQFEGFSSTCTHLGCTVANIYGGKIICPCHGSMYSIKDGSVLGGPAPAPLPKKPVKVDGTNIVLA